MVQPGKTLAWPENASSTIQLEYISARASARPWPVGAEVDDFATVYANERSWLEYRPTGCGRWWRLGSSGLDLFLGGDRADRAGIDLDLLGVADTLL